MRPDAKAVQEPTRWAGVTLHSSLPSEAEQIAGARAWGAVRDWLGEIGVSRIFTDDVRSVRRTTNWRAKLPMREALITALSVTPSPLNHVFFKSPLCIGFSEKHATEVIHNIWNQQALVFVQSQFALYRVGDDISELIEAVGRDAKAARQRRYRALRPD